MGNNAVAARGIASVIHQMAIKTTIAAIRVTIGLPGCKSTKIKIKRNARGPNHKPILLRSGTSLIRPLSMDELFSELLVIYRPFPKSFYFVDLLIYKRAKIKTSS
jgi:hypothetical protein